MKIHKIRTIPRGFTELSAGDVLRETVGQVEKGRLFLNLYKKVGAPSKDMSYMVRIDKYVLYMPFDDREPRIWVSAALRQIADKRRTKRINIMARTANINDVAFPKTLNEKIFSAVKKKNDTILAKERLTPIQIEEKFYAFVGDKGKQILNGDVVFFLPEVREMLCELTKEE